MWLALPLLVLVGVIELLLRFVIVAALLATVFGLLAVLTETNETLSSLLTPYAWRIVARAAGGN